MKKKLFMFQHYASHASMPGRTRHHHMALSISDQYKFYIFSSGFSHEQKDFLKNYRRFNIAKRENIDGVNYIWLKTFPYYQNNWRRTVNVLDYSAKALIYQFSMNEKPDIVIASIAHNFSLAVGFVISRRFKVPYIVDIGDLWPDALVELGHIKKNSLKNNTMEWLTYPFYRMADQVMCLSDQAKERMIELGIEDKKIHVIHPYRDMQYISTEYRDDRNNFNVFYGGSFNESVPVDLLIDAAQKLNNRCKDIRFIFMGFGAYKEILLKASKQLSNMEVHDSVPQKELFSKYFKLADLFLVAEKNILFGFPNKLVDYALYGKPILIVSPNRYFEDHQPGINFATPTKDDLTKKIIESYSSFKGDFEKYKEAGLANRKLANNLFSKARYRTSLIKCLENS